MPREGPNRWCVRGVDISEMTYTVCDQAPGTVPPAHRDFLNDFSATWRTHGCAGFGTHHDTSTLDALGVDPLHTLTVTVLRHPVDRIISYYYFAVAHGLDVVKAHAFAPANASDYTDLLRFAEKQANMMTLQIAGVRGVHFCAWPHAPDPAGLTNEQLLERAKRRLDAFCLVLIQVSCVPRERVDAVCDENAPPLVSMLMCHLLSCPHRFLPALQEHMGESLARLQARTGWNDSTIYGLEPRNTNANKPVGLPLMVRRRIAKLNQLDMRLYEYAVQQFLASSNLSSIENSVSCQ